MLIWLKPLVNLTVDFKVVSTRKKEQQNKRLFSQLSEAGTGFMIGQNNHGVQTESRDNVTYRGTFLDNTNNPTQDN